MVFHATVNNIAVISSRSVLLVEEIFGVFHVKNHNFTPKKNHIFTNFRGAGGRARRVLPPLNPPLYLVPVVWYIMVLKLECHIYIWSYSPLFTNYCTTDFRILNTVIFTIKYRVSRGLVELLFM